MKLHRVRPSPDCARVPNGLRARMRGGTRKHRGRGLTARQAGYVLGLLSGKSERRAALDAGYTEETARNAAQNVEGKCRGRFSIVRQFVQALGENRLESSGTEEKGIWRPPGNARDTTMETDAD